MNRKTAILITAFIFLISPLWSQDIQVEPSFSFAYGVDFSPAFNAGFQLNAVEVEITAEPISSMKLNIGLDFLKIAPDTVVSEIVQDAYIRLDIQDSLRLYFGQFKIPFLVENEISGKKRPHLENSGIGKELSPGRDRGVMVKLQLPADFYIKGGVFNGHGIDEFSFDEFRIMGFANAGYEAELFKDFVLLTQYAAFIRLKQTPRELRFAHTAGVYVNWKPAKGQKLFFTTQYTESTDDSELLNYQPEWEWGFSGALGYRLEMIEVYGAGEYDYLGNMGLQAGVNLYTFKDDLLKLTLEYQFTSEPDATDQHQIQSVCTLNL